tara:strand:+ start:121 stop:651 length:531 start_codon:yes stop_codon:yes gene_type:complete
MKTKKIILVGYMGSGKTAVGSLLKNKLNLPFWDLDIYLEQKLNKSIASIFQSKGELYFRKEERKALEELLKLDEQMIISLGGGTPCYYDTMEYLNSQNQVKTFYLQTDIKTLSKRLELEKHTRPLISHIKNIEKIQEFVGKHLFERNPFYVKSDYKLVTQNKSIENVATEIGSLLT